MRFGAIAVLSLVLYLPFYQKYQALASGIGLVRSRTPVGYYLAITGFFLFAIVSYMVVDMVAQRRASGSRLLRLFVSRFDDLPMLAHRLRLLVRPRTTFTTAVYGMLMLAFVLVLLVVLKQGIIVLLLPLLLLAVVLGLAGERTPEHMFVWLLAFLGLLVSLGIEIFFLRDWLQGGSAYRMNTLFKFGIQVWVFFGLAVGSRSGRDYGARAVLAAALGQRQERLVHRSGGAAVRRVPVPVARHPGACQRPLPRRSARLRVRSMARPSCPSASTASTGRARTIRST